MIPSAADLPLTALAFEQVTVSTSAVGLTAATYSPTGENGAQRALISVDTNDIRIRFDGNDPTATVGHKVLADGDPVIIDGLPNIANVSMIRDTGAAADATANVTYLR